VRGLGGIADRLTVDPTEKIACVLGVHQPGIPQQQNVIMRLGE
jgi:hypothetical protein